MDGDPRVLDDHDEEGELDAQGALGVSGAGDVVGRDVGANDLEDRRLNVGVGDALDVAVADCIELERAEETQRSVQQGGGIFTTAASTVAFQGKESRFS